MTSQPLKVLQRASNTCLQTHARCCRHVCRHALGCRFKLGWRVGQLIHQAQLQQRETDTAEVVYICELVPSKFSWRVDS